MKHADIIGKLTIEQKATLLTGRDFWSTKDYPEQGIPSAYLSDGPHGLRKQQAAADHLGLNPSIPATCYPTAATMANSWNPALGEELGEYLGTEAASMEVNVLLGPGMNIKRNPLCGRNFEYFSEDPYLAGKMAAAYVRGIQKKGVSGCLKHFACNNQEQRRMVIDTVVDERTLREIYLTGFEIAVEEGKPKTIMSSYNKLNGTHTNENMHLMRDILRGEWGYDKVLVTDWAGSNDRIQGVIAGNELEMPGCKYGIDDVVKALTEGYEIPEYVQEYPEQYNAVLKGIKEGKLDEKLVDEALDRLLDLILETDKAVKQAPKQFNTEEHHLFAQKCAEECMVLLKNEKGVLPLTEKEKVCIIGDFAENPRYQGAGSSVVNPTKVDNVLDCVAEYPIRFIGYTKGYERYGKKSGKLEKYALKLAEEADKIVFFAGLDEVSEAEGIDRRDMKLPANQLEVLSKLLALGKPVVVVLCCGSAVELDVIDDADAVVHAYLSGQAGARAILGVLSGKVNPSGKLAESYPVRYEDCSSAARFPGKAASVEYREALYVGYRYYDTAGVAVRYPFGFGLSYTKFEYSDIKADEKGVTFTLKNAGEKDGAEVAQLYIGKKDGKVFRPAKELKGFAKVFLKAGESKNVFIPFDKYTFRYYNVSTKAWEEEPGAYQVMLGASSADIRLNAEVTRAGTKAACPYDKAKLPSYYSGKAEDVGKEEYEALLGKPLPRAGYRFYKKRRMVIDENATVADLRFSRRWVGRLFSAVIRFAHSFLWAIGQKTTANTIMMGMYHQPVRGLAKYGAMSRKQMEALLMMFNGHLFKGIGQFFSKADKPKAEKDKA